MKLRRVLIRIRIVCNVTHTYYSTYVSSVVGCNNNDVDTTQCASVKPRVCVTVEKSPQTPSEVVDVFVVKMMEQAFGATMTTTISDCNHSFWDNIWTRVVHAQHQL